ncbi:846_t:CDS:2, partial [Funneliformis geosporum]
VENNEELTTILDDVLSSCQEIPFMTIDSEGLTEKINGIYRYILRLYDRLINSQKALVTLIGIQVFFDILISDRKTLDECEEKLGLTIQTMISILLWKKPILFNILEWMWERITEKFETRDEILKWKYREKIGVKSENVFKKKDTVKAPEKREKDLEEKEYLGTN